MLSFDQLHAPVLLLAGHVAQLESVRAWILDQGCPEKLAHREVASDLLTSLVEHGPVALYLAILEMPAILDHSIYTDFVQKALAHEGAFLPLSFVQELALVLHFSKSTSESVDKLAFVNEIFPVLTDTPPMFPVPDHLTAILSLW